MERFLGCPGFPFGLRSLPKALLASSSQRSIRALAASLSRRLYGRIGDAPDFGIPAIGVDFRRRRSVNWFDATMAHRPHGDEEQRSNSIARDSPMFDTVHTVASVSHPTLRGNIRRDHVAWVELLTASWACNRAVQNLLGEARMGPVTSNAPRHQSAF